MGISERNDCSMDLNNQKHFSKKYYSKLVMPALALNITLLLAFVTAVFAAAKIQGGIEHMKYMKSSGDLSSTLVKDYMYTKNIWVDIIAESPDVAAFLADTRYLSDEAALKNSDNWANVKNKLDEAFRYDDDIQTAWIVSESNGTLIANGGSFIAADDYDLKNQNWYSKFLVSKGTRIYYNSALSKTVTGFDEEVVTIISAVYDNEQTIGYCGIEISLSGLKNVLDRYAAGGDYYIVIASEFGENIYTPCSMDENIDAQAIVISAARRPARVFAGVIETHIDSATNKTMHYYVDGTGVNGWTVFVFF